MKPDWDKLGAMYKGSPNLVIADVDCTMEGNQPLCERMDVKGYPTILSFKANDPVHGKDGQKYEKGRDLASLKQFCKKTLKGKELVCDMLTKKDCTEKELEFIASVESKDLAAIKSDLATVNKQLEQ